jgi:TonB family protein
MVNGRVPGILRVLDICLDPGLYILWGTMKAFFIAAVVSLGVFWSSILSSALTLGAQEVNANTENVFVRVRFPEGYAPRKGGPPRQVAKDDQVIIHVQLFRGAWAEGHAALKEITTLMAASHPEIEALKAKLDVSDNELTAAVIDALLETQSLKTVDEYFIADLKWNGRSGQFTQDIRHAKYGFKIIFEPRRLSPQYLELGISLYKSKEDPLSSSLPADEPPPKDAAKTRPSPVAGASMDKILDTKLQLGLGNPAIVGVPYGHEAFFMMIYWKTSKDTSEIPGGKGSRPAAEIPPIQPPKVVHTLMPSYPEELRQKGIQGQVGLQVAISKQGEVTEVRVVNPLHPYLDFAAVQALRQWTYEPALQNGEPIPVLRDITVIFDPEVYRRFEERARDQEGTPGGGKQQSSSLLTKVLGGSAEYCRKLAFAALDFICEETIKEVHYKFATEPKWAGLVVASRETGRIVSSSWTPMWDPLRTEKTSYLCDYLMVKRGETIEESRIILKENGRSLPDRSRRLEEKRFTSLNPLLAAIQILATERQPRFYFRLLQADKVDGRNAHVIEAIPKSGNTWGVEYAKIWIDQASYRVIKSEIQGVPLEGYDDVLRDATRFNIRPYLTITHAYKQEKNGVLFPNRTTIRVDYPALKPSGNKTLKLKIDMAYDKYRFFSVDTETHIKR